jgi:hypothetical protein
VKTPDPIVSKNISGILYMLSSQDSVPPKVESSSTERCVSATTIETIQLTNF